jgi:hypothetical protein
MLESNTPDQPKDPGDGSNDGNGKGKPEGNYCAERIKYKCKISESPAGTSGQDRLFIFA